MSVVSHIMKHFLRGISLTIVLTSFLVCPTATDKSKGEERIVGIAEWIFFLSYVIFYISGVHLNNK